MAAPIVRRSFSPPAVAEKKNWNKWHHGTLDWFILRDITPPAHRLRSLWQRQQWRRAHAHPLSSLLPPDKCFFFFCITYLFIYLLPFFVCRLSAFGVSEPSNLRHAGFARRCRDLSTRPPCLRAHFKPARGRFQSTKGTNSRRGEREPSLFDECHAGVWFRGVACSRQRLCWGILPAAGPELLLPRLPDLLKVGGEKKTKKASLHISM